MKTGYSFGSLVSFVEALNAAAVKITGDQTIAGLKTFSSNPITSAAQGSGDGYLTRKDYVDGALALKAPLTSPTLTGIPTAPTATAGTNTTQIATTAFVTSANTAQLATADPLMDGTVAVGTSTLLARQDHRHPTDTTRAPLASPAFTGTPTAPTQTVGNNSTRVATTAFVQTAKESARTTTYIVGSEAAMLALSSSKKGDLAIRSDLNNRTFILSAEPYSTLANWEVLAENVFISDFAKTLLDDADGVYKKNNILGALSQVGGVPTGAIIERGSNSNGEYVKFADGTLICTMRATFNGGAPIAKGPFFITTNAYQWTYPAAFIATPSFSISAMWGDATTSTASQAWGVQDRGPESSLVVAPSVRLMVTVTWANLIGFVRFIAIGRWY